jgi:hypothetical protein
MMLALGKKATLWSCVNVPFPKTNARRGDRWCERYSRFDVGMQSLPCESYHSLGA